ncbi:MAG: hypothetical protein QM775_10875 [Pirellulales bacterium]
MYTNIQKLFSIISLPHIRAYLTGHGWNEKGGETTDRAYFERTFAGGEKPAIVWIWSSPEHKRFRNQVPNVIFTLSVLESRPALDIANEMFAAELPKPAAAPAAESSAPAKPVVAATPASTVPQRLILRFDRETNVTIVHDDNSDTTRTAAGDVIELLHARAAGTDLELTIGDGSVTAAMAQAGGLRVLQGVAKPSVGPHWSAVQIVRDELRPLEDAGESKTAARLLEELEPIMARIDFELDVNAPINDHQQSLVLRQTAVLTAALAQRLDESTEAVRVVWRTAAKLMYPVGRRLQLSSTAAVELFQTAKEDDQLRPANVLAWLRDNSRSVVN